MHAFKKYKARVGREKALAELMLRKVSPRTADNLCGDEDYGRELRSKIRKAIEEIVAKAS